MDHLDDATYRRLLAGTLPPDEARRLSRHLETECAECEAFLAGRGEADALDGRVDRALAALGPPGSGRGDDLEFARIERRLRATQRRRRVLVPAALLAAAAAIAAAGIAGLVAPHGRGERHGWTGEKGSAAAAPVRLRFLVLTPGPAGVQIEKGVTGAAVGAGSSLQFEIEATRPADAALVRVPSQGVPDWLWHARVAPGITELSVDGGPAAFPLAGVAGPQRFVLLASEDGLDEGRLSRVARALAAPQGAAQGDPALAGISVDAVEVVVR